VRDRARFNLRIVDQPGPQAAQTLPAARHRTTVSHVDDPDPAVGAGRAADGRAGRDPPDQARLRQLAEEQAALRRVATLVARGEPPEAVFAAVVEEVGQLLSVELANLCRYEPDRAATVVAAWGTARVLFPVGDRLPLEGYNLTTLVFETSRPARIDRYDDASGSLGVAVRETGIRSAVGTPVIVEGRLWGLILAASTLERPLPPDTEARLASFTELVATAVANTDGRAALARLAQEQAALRRVATLVARATPPEEVFAAVAEEVGRLLPIDLAMMGRFEPDRMETIVAAWGTAGVLFPVGNRWPIDGYNLAALVFETGRPARIDRYGDASGSLGVAVRDAGISSAAGTPILVEGNLWGAIFAASTGDQPLPADTEARLASFTELVATAIANTDGRAALARLAQEQAALRRVATLVARGEPPEAVFAAVAEEVGRLLGVDFAILVRYDPQDMLEVVGAWTRTGAPAPTPVGGRLPLGGRNVTTVVYRTGRPARIDYSDVSGVIGEVASRGWGMRSSVGVPVSAESRLWGCIVVAFADRELLPADTEARLASFTELVATAIANTDSRAALARLAQEQAALRRVATLVARGEPPEAVFAAVLEEVGRLLPIDLAMMGRFEPDRTATCVATWRTAGDIFPVGSKLPLEGYSLGTLVFETGRPARIDHYADASGPIGTVGRVAGLGSMVGAPVIVEDRLWGLITAGSALEQPLPPDAEARLVSFTELVATAIANAQSRAELIASRARIVAASDETRRRIERDLHDGTQQQLVSLMLELRQVQAAAPPGLEGGLSRIDERVTDVFNQVREISHGIHPAILSERGLTPALKALARRSAVAVELDLRTGRRLPDHVEVAAYYAVSEALANAAKHAQASVVHVELDTPSTLVRLAIRDDGIGGADPAQGSGLTGLRDRIEALGGTLDVTSPADGGTTLLIEIPV
jgi:GAF domain-containing protein